MGPGSPKYLTDIAKEAIRRSRYIVGYKYTLNIIKDIINRRIQEIHEVTLDNQEQIYQHIYAKMKDGHYCAIPFTGDVNFSESEVVDRLLELFGDDNVEIIPGISSIQIAAAKSRVPLDKAHIVTFHVSGDIEQKKVELLRAVRDMKSVILLPRPWPRDTVRKFMESDIAVFLKKNGIFVNNVKVALGMFVPAIGTVIGISSGFSTGMVFSAMAKTSPILNGVPPLIILFTPFGIMEIFAYGLAMSRSGMLIYQLVRKKSWKEYAIPIIIEVGIVVVILFIGAIIEWDLIQQVGRFNNGPAI